MGQSEIDAVRALLSSKPRPVGWTARRQRIEEVGSAWPAASDIRFEQVEIDGFPGEWSIAPGSDAVPDEPHRPDQLKAVVPLQPLVEDHRREHEAQHR